jgi:hypothetical protein
MSKELATTNGFVVTKTSQGIWIPGTPAWNKTSSSKSKAGGDTILTQSLSWNMSGCSCPAYTFVSGSGTIQASATKCKCEGKFPLLKGDQEVCHGTFTLTASPFTPLSCSCVFEITDAGQVKAKGV